MYKYKNKIKILGIRSTRKQMNKKYRICETAFVRNKVMINFHIRYKQIQLKMNFQYSKGIKVNNKKS